MQTSVVEIFNELSKLQMLAPEESDSVWNIAAIRSVATFAPNRASVLVTLGDETMQNRSLRLNVCIAGDMLTFILWTRGRLFLEFNKSMVALLWIAWRIHRHWFRFVPT